MEEPQSVPITSPEKPEIGNNIRGKWQKIIDVMAGCFDVPAGLIMQLDQKKISVFLSSKTPGNPYAEEASDTLLHGLYCETVVGLDKQLLVSDAREDALWYNNPDVKLGMISYLGFPIKWPDGEFFGTICVLDKKRNEYSRKFIDLMQILKDSIERDLRQLLQNYNELKKAYDSLEHNVHILEETKEELLFSLQEKNILLSEIHHRVKNNLQIISSLVDLQPVPSGNTLLQAQLLNIKNRIQAMGVLHEILYKSKDFEKVPIKQYIELLIKYLKNSIVDNKADYSLDLNVDENLVFNLDTAIPVGLILNEIITNSFKHAFSENEKGSITIEIREETAPSFTLKISDNGCGIPENNIKGLGLEIIDTLVYQLNGKMKMKSENGTSYSITLNKVTKEGKRWSIKS